MKDQQHLEILEDELKPLFNSIGKAMDTILEEGISEYPIIVVHQNAVELGVDILGLDQATPKWRISASTLEEFVAKQLIQSDKVDDFKSVYKDPDMYLCMFIIDDMFAKFIFKRRR